MTVQWSYIGFPCSACKQPIVVLTVPYEAQTPHIFSQVVYHMPCPNCHEPNVCPATALVRFEAEQIFM
jgi:hypothetical protein